MRAKRFNSLLDLYRRKRPRYVRHPSPGPIHPWKTTAAWDGTLKKWCATTRPGFVNGLDPLVPGVTVPNEKFEPLKDTADKKLRPASLCDGAPMPLLDFRDGFEGMSAGAKLYFKTRGAVPPTSNTTASVDLSGERIVIVQTGVDSPSASWRTVLAVDLYVSEARPTLVGKVDIVDATGITGQIAQYGAAYDTQALDLYGTRARFQQAPAFPAKAAMPTAMDIFKGVPGDDGEDRIPVCTVFLLSPAQVPDSGQTLHLDGSWSAHVQHHLFWNVIYAAKYGVIAFHPTPIRLTTGLWLADTIGNQILSPLNDLSNALVAAFQSRNPEGQFYTV